MFDTTEVTINQVREYLFAEIKGIKFKLFWLSELLVIFLQASASYKDINFSKQIQNYFLTWALVMSVVSNLSHSDYLNLPLSTTSSGLQKKKEMPELFCNFS